MAAETSGVWPITWNPSAPRWPGYPKVATRTPGAGAESVRVARDFTAATLARWEIGERGEDIVVVVSDLVTNALRYTVPCPGSVWPRWPISHRARVAAVKSLATRTDSAPAPGVRVATFG